MGGITTLNRPELAYETCVRRLAAAGLHSAPGNSDDQVHFSFPSNLGPQMVECEISWFGPSGFAGTKGDESTVQAISGLMHVHGRDSGKPLPIHLEISSIASGLLASIGVLAAAIGRFRGNQISKVCTSPLQAAILYISHYVAMATASNGWLPPPSTGPGPPFRSAEGHCFEIETLHPEHWKAFWSRVGLEGPDVGEAWMRFCLRYPLGMCSLPAALHAATVLLKLDEIEKIGWETDVTLVTVLKSGEFLEEVGSWPGLPKVEAIRTAPNDHLQTSENGAESATSRSGLPLSGLKVVEATSLVQGPLAGLLLSMLGAEVTKIEPPGGDPARIVPPLAGGLGVVFSCFNRPKKSVQLNLATPQGRAELLELAAGADAFLNNWRAGRAEKWNLTAQDFAKANPEVVWAQATAWGSVQGRDHLLGTDATAQAYSGLGDFVWPPHEASVPSRVLLADLTGGLVAAEGVLHGLLQRELAGGAFQIETSLVAAGAALENHQLAGRSRNGFKEQGVTTEAVTDLRSLVTDSRLNGFFDPLGDGCFAAGPPWNFS